MIICDHVRPLFVGRICRSTDCRRANTPHEHDRTCSLRCSCRHYGEGDTVELLQDATAHIAYLQEASRPSGLAEAAMVFALDGRSAMGAVKSASEVLTSRLEETQKEMNTFRNSDEFYPLKAYAVSLGTAVYCKGELALAQRWFDRVAKQ